MSTYSIAEAMEKLPELIDRALNGEAIMIERDGRPVAELRPINVWPERRITDEHIDWLEEHRIPGRKASIDAVTLIREMRAGD